MDASLSGTASLRSPATEYALPGPGERRLCVAEYGDSHGIPVIYCHGFPTCRREAALGDRAARQAGVRLIAVDRPGYGGSSPQPGRCIVDWAGDVSTIADALGLDRFYLLGVSGGAPFALACPALLGDRVIATAIVCGLAPIADAASTRGMITVQRLGLALAGTAPALSARVMTPLAAAPLRRVPQASLGLLRAMLPAPDREVLRDPAVATTISDALRQAFENGSGGAARDLLLFTRPWGFSLHQVRGPVTLWHGGRDRTVPARMGRQLAAALPDCRAHFLDAEGHFSLPVRHLETIAAGLVRRRGRRRAEPFPKRPAQGEPGSRRP